MVENGDVVNREGAKDAKKRDFLVCRVDGKAKEFCSEDRSRWAKSRRQLTVAKEGRWKGLESED